MASEMGKRQWRWAFAFVVVPAMALVGLLGFACELPTHASDFATAVVPVGDGGITCPSSQTLCIGADGTETCSDLTDDPSNCGGCGVACPATQSCLAGDAGPACGCGGSTQLCAGACLDLSSNPTHCGSCDTVCGADTICAGGACVTTCQSGQTNCSESCTNVAIDSTNCGECGHGCGAGTICSAASCVGSDGGCGAGLTSCSSTGCVDLTQDSKNCGVCDKQCGASQSCLGSLCVCSSGTTNCGGTCAICPAGGICGGTVASSDSDPTDCVCAKDFNDNDGVHCCSSGTSWIEEKGKCCSGSKDYCCDPGEYLCANQPTGQPGLCLPTRVACTLAGH